ncbi:hypothetical protein [Aquisphaera insulae]|uniref:hypothetical protein n=1 Tax=Aquisphaera insulae TaxID=2712864 RepID=UPI0013EB7E49|nr:hypothetical protein [Aquisphaera insulae]
MIELAEERTGRAVAQAVAFPSTSVPARRDEADWADFRLWRSRLIEGFERSAVRPQIPGALVGLAFIHLAGFLLCQASYVPDGKANLWHPVLWLAELIAVLAYWRRLMGRNWARTSVAINLVVKFWTTFLILSFTVVTSNWFTGYELAWYKPVWGTLSTFLFASMAWLFTPLFFIPAVQMGLTGTLMVNLPDHAFLIYGVSWWIALVGVAAWMQRRDRQALLAPAD